MKIGDKVRCVSVNEKYSTVPYIGEIYTVMGTDDSRRDWLLFKGKNSMSEENYYPPEIANKCYFLKEDFAPILRKRRKR